MEQSLPALLWKIIQNKLKVYSECKRIVSGYLEYFGMLRDI